MAAETKIPQYMKLAGMDYLDLAVKVRDVSNGVINTSPSYLKSLAEGQAEPKYIMATAIVIALGLQLSDMADVFPGIDFAKQA